MYLYANDFPPSWNPSGFYKYVDRPIFDSASCYRDVLQDTRCGSGTQRESERQVGIQSVQVCRILPLLSEREGTLMNYHLEKSELPEPEFE